MEMEVGGGGKSSCAKFSCSCVEVVLNVLARAQKASSIDRQTGLRVHVCIGLLERTLEATANLCLMSRIVCVCACLLLLNIAERELISLCSPLHVHLYSVSSGFPILRSDGTRRVWGEKQTASYTSHRSPSGRDLATASSCFAIELRVRAPAGSRFLS